ncbi:MAG: extracellular solute-binding protein [Limnochordia bacterium]|nr:extracellular solute-binding protein [Bacillota bacterium]HBG10629.1 ABC transporter substrate-binding protein [Bacillota bacterium]
MKRTGLVIAVLALCMMLSGAALAQTIEVWHIYVSNHQTRPTLDHAIERFEAANPGVKIESVPIVNDEYKTKLMISMGAGDEPDIFLSWGGGPLLEYVNAGKVWDMKDALEETGLKDNFMDVTLGPVNFNGGIYGVPLNNVVGAAIFYRTDIFERLGLEIPTTLEELYEVAEVLKANNIYPFTLANFNRWTGSMFFMYLVDRIGGPETFENAANRTGGAFNDEPFVRAGEIIQDMVDAGFFPPGFNSMNEDYGQSRTLLYTGQAAMYLMGSWATATITTENPDVLENIDFFLFPAVEGGKGDPTNMIGTPGNNYFSISNKCENKELALEFLRYMTDSTSAELLVQANAIPPFVGGGDLLTNPLMIKLFETVQAANNVQLWYDQYLPPELAQVHLDTTQAIFGGTMTPQEAADAMEAAAQRFYNE